MIPKDDVSGIAACAHADVAKFLAETKLASHEVLTRRVGVRAFRAYLFARVAISAEVVRLTRLPRPGYVSWLFGPMPQIAIDLSQIDQWSPDDTSRGDSSQEIETCHADVQEFRAILHEVGHCRLQGDYLLSEKRIQPSGYAPQSTPEEEEAAWFYAGVAMACILGDYSFWARKLTDHDNTPSIPI